MSYLVNYGTWKKLFEQATQDVATLIENAKKSDEGTEVSSKPAYEPLFAWFEEYAPTGAKNKSVTSENIKKMLEYWAGDSSRAGKTKYATIFPALELFSDATKANAWLAAVGEASGRQGSYADGIDFNKIAENSKKLYDLLKKLETEGWIIKNGIPVEYSESQEKGKTYLGYRPKNLVDPEKLERTKARQWDEGEASAAYKNFVAWQKNLNSNIETMMDSIAKEDENIFYRGAVQMESKNKVELLDKLQARAEKYVSGEKAKYDTADEAIKNAYKIRIAPSGKIERTEKTETVSEPTENTVTSVASKSIATAEQAKAMFKNNEANFLPGYADSLINSIIASIDDVKKIEGFSKITEITFKVVASTNVIPTTFAYNGKTGNDALVEARADALTNQVVNPALAKLGDLKNVAKINEMLAPNNSNETTHPGSSKWVKGGNVDDPKYAEFRFSTIMIDITYETTATSTTPGETVQDVDYSGEWKIEISFEKIDTPTGGGGQRVPRRFLNRRSSDTVTSCDKMCAAYN